MEFSVQCESRKPGVKPKAMRRDGQIPAVLYGHDGTNAVSLAVPAKTAEALLKKVTINNSIISVQVPSLKLDCKSLLRDVQFHPVNQKTLHLSFFSVASQSSIQVTVPIHTVGTPKGVELSGGVMDIRLSELELSCSPTNIPETVEVDVTGLDVGDSIHVNELTLPDGAESVGEPGRLVLAINAKAAAPAPDADEEAAPAADAEASAEES